MNTVEILIPSKLVIVFEIIELYFLLSSSPGKAGLSQKQVLKINKWGEEERSVLSFKKFDLPMKNKIKCNLEFLLEKWNKPMLSTMETLISFED